MSFSVQDKTSLVLTPDARSDPATYIYDVHVICSAPGHHASKRLVGVVDATVSRDAKCVYTCSHPFTELVFIGMNSVETTEPPPIHFRGLGATATEVTDATLMLPYITSDPVGSLVCMHIPTTYTAHTNTSESTKYTCPLCADQWVYSSKREFLTHLLPDELRQNDVIDIRSLLSMIE